jgi:hypothetical protein
MTTDADGKYELPFGRGVMVLEQKEPFCQAASIFASKQGYSERNLCRQGGCVAAEGFKLGEKPDFKKLNAWGNPPERVFLPGVAKEINFVMLPAARVGGRLIDADENPLEGYSVSLIGKELPPSSSSLRQVHTDAEGRFTIEDIPPGYKFQFLIHPAKREHPWLAWATGPFEFAQPDEGFELNVLQRSGKEFVQSVMQSKARRFEIQVLGEGTNWKHALATAAGAHQPRYLLTGAKQMIVLNQTNLQADKLRMVLGSPADAEGAKSDE